MTAVLPGGNNRPSAEVESGVPDGLLAILKYDKPWGAFERYAYNQECTVKIITVAPGGSLSRQYHNKRDELWVILDRGAGIELGEEILKPEPGEKIFVPRRVVHRLSAANEPVRVLEVSFGQFDEDDIVRLEDNYGRMEPTNGSCGPSELRIVVDGRLQSVAGR